MGYYSDVAISCYKSELVRELQNLQKTDAKGYEMVMRLLADFDIVTYKYDDPEQDMYLMTINCKWNGYKDEDLLLKLLGNCNKGAYLTRIGEEYDDIEQCNYIGAYRGDLEDDYDLMDLVRLNIGYGTPSDKYNFLLTGEPYFKNWKNNLNNGGNNNAK